MYTTNLIFGVSILMSLIAWNQVGKRYFGFQREDRDFKATVTPILLLHSFRFIGLSFLVPGVVNAGLDPSWAVPAAAGDMSAAVLALTALFLIKTRSFRLFVWIFNIVGAADLLLAFVRGPLENIVPSLGAAYFIIIIPVPLLILTHITVFKLLLHNRPVE
jgi:hypothetical protein